MNKSAPAPSNNLAKRALQRDMADLLASVLT
jgi:hypothetical protein